jgi:uncharacterized membrane protein
MDFTRIIRHLSTPTRAVRRVLPLSAMRAIAEAIRQGETRHSGEIRFAVESALDLPPLLHGQSPRERACEVFAQLRVWDTAENNGVLIYLLLADRQVEIVADRGVHARVGAGGWEAICQRMEGELRAGRFEAGVLEGIHAVTEILVREYPASGPNTNELPDQPVVLR